MQNTGVSVLGAKKWPAALLIGLMVIATGCGQQQKSQEADQNMIVVESKSNNTIEFEQVGYYKGDNNLRYLTFYVDAKGAVNTDSEDFYNQLKDHGSKQANTSGKVTASFYYLDKNAAPDITALDADGANNLAHERKPVAAVWIMPKGQINLIMNPE